MASILLAITSAAGAQDTTSSPRPAAGVPDTLAAPRLPAVEVIATREGERSPLDVPFAVTRTSPDAERPGLSRSAIDDLVAHTPGVLASDRANPAQDPRLSIRGFGARSAFGVRALHVRRDGLPLTMPDGQTAIDAIELESVESIEVLRGPASSLYGNSAGGVVEMLSPPLRAGATEGWGRAVASGDWNRFSAGAAGSAGNVRHQLTLSRRSTTGPRSYASARATAFYGRAAVGTPGRQLTAIASLYDLPWADAPGALTLEELERDPTLADPAGVRRRAGKEVRQRQVGVVAEWSFGSTTLATTAHGLTRAVRNPLPFRVVDFDRVALGTSVRATRTMRSGATTHYLSAGIDYQRQDDDRWNFANCADTIMPSAPTATCPTVGEQRGVLLLDQQEVVGGTGLFARGDLGIAGRLRASAGVRYDRVGFRLRDRFLDDGRDDSGSRTLSAVSPSVGLNFRFAALHSLYANLASAFETPTTTELTNQPDGSAGINRELRPQRSVTTEIGARGFARRLAYDLAVFQSRVDDELVPFEVAGGGGRRYFRNAGRTTRRGAEAALGLRVPTTIGALELGATWTHSAFRYDEYEITTIAGDVVSFAGRRVPGVPENQLRTRAALWRGGWFAGADLAASGSAFADDANMVRVPGYTIVNLRAGGRGLFHNPWLSPAVELSNVFGVRYTPSIVVNAQGGRYYEPAPGRRLTLSLGVGAGGAR